MSSHNSASPSAVYDSDTMNRLLVLSKSMLLLFVVLSLSVFLNVSATNYNNKNVMLSFVHPNLPMTVSSSQQKSFDVSSRPATLPNTRLMAVSKNNKITAKKNALNNKNTKKTNDTADENTALLLALRWISPLNPYMLFVYPIAFIFLVDALDLGPK